MNIQEILKQQEEEFVTFKEVYKNFHNNDNEEFIDGYISFLKSFIQSYNSKIIKAVCEETAEAERARITEIIGTGKVKSLIDLINLLNK